MLDIPYVPLLLFILGFGFLVFVHELGHFLVAKWVGIRATQFAIGFGHSILSWRKGLGFRTGSTEPEYRRRAAELLASEGVDPEKLDEQHREAKLYEAGDRLGLGETEYRLNWVPLGGYVKMLGQEDLDPGARSPDPRAYNSKPIWARMCVISAGVVMNVIFGMIFLVIAFRIGVNFPAAVVGGTMDDAPADVVYAQGHQDDPAYRGLRVGDHITAIDGRRVVDMLDVRINTALASDTKALDFEVRRPGYDEPLHYHIVPRPDPETDLLAIGIDVSPTLTVSGLAPGSDAEKAGVKPGMTVTAVDGQPVETYADYYHATIAAAGVPSLVTFRDNDTGETIDVQLNDFPMMTGGGEQPTNLLGMMPPVHVSMVMEDSPAERAGLEAGDVLVEIGELTWPTSSKAIQDEIKAIGREPFSITVWRDGELVTIDNLKKQRRMIGIGMEAAYDQPMVAGVLRESPAESLNLTQGSRIIAIDNQPVESWIDIQRILGSLPVEEDEPTVVEVAYRLNIAGQPEESVKMVISPQQSAELVEAPWAPPTGVAFTQLEHLTKGETMTEAATIGLVKTHQFMVQTYQTIVSLLRGTVKTSHLRGPVGIVDEGNKIAQRGWSYLLFFLGLISINLAVLNFLPIPIVDGGHMVFLIMEKVKGSPVSARVQIGAMYVGLAMLGCIFLLVTYNDIARIVHNWIG